MNIVLIDDDIDFLNKFKIKIIKYFKEIFDDFDIDSSTDTSILKEKNIEYTS